MNYMYKPFAIAGIAFYVAYLVYYLYVIFKNKSQEQATAAKHEANAGASLGTLALVATLVATMLGPADTIGLSQNGFLEGYVWFAFPLCAALQHIISGLFAAGKINKRSTSGTLGGLFNESYGHTGRYYIGTITFLQAIAFSGVLVLAGAQILSQYFETPMWVGLFFTAFLIGIYTSLGGIKAVLDTDKIQFYLISLFAIFAVTGVVLLLLKNGLPEAKFFWNPSPASINTKFILATACAYFFGEALLPFYSQRAMMAKTPKIASLSFIITGIAIGFWYLLMATLGVLAHDIPGLSQDTPLMFSAVIHAAFGDSIVLQAITGALIPVALLALVHSTFDSVLNSGAVAFTLDVWSPLFGLEDDGAVASKSLKRIIRWLVFIIAIGGIFAALLGDSLISILLIGYTIWVPAALVPLAATVFWPKVRFGPIPLISSALGGVIGYYFGELIFPKLPIPGILWGLIFSYIFFHSTHLLSASRDKKHRQSA
jgi:solute:Na+ symporter, SSS family